jgi:hypothetical protein
MIPAALLLMRRMVRALRYAARDEGFLPVLASGLLLVATGAVAYGVGEGWSAIDALYFATTTLTTTGSADPHLVLSSGALKLFTVFYQLIGIGILVELMRRLGVSFVAAGPVRRHQERHGHDEQQGTGVS